jgi:hypothetical protein
VACTRHGAFFGLAFTAALNPKLLGADLLIIETRWRGRFSSASWPAAWG